MNFQRFYTERITPFAWCIMDRETNTRVTNEYGKPRMFWDYAAARMQCERLNDQEKANAAD